MLFNLVINFILPKYLSLDSYAAIKTYQLYISYIGALHLGFIDGVYLKYGGDSLTTIDKNELSINLGTMRIFQIVISTILIIISIIIHNTVLLFFSLAIVPLNIANYFASLYQATGEFNKYGRIINATAIMNCCVNAFFIFIIKTDNYCFYLTSYILINTLIWLILEYGFKKNYGNGIKTFTFSFFELSHSVRAGILLMLGNLSSFVLTGLDRWFVKFFMDTVDFALYSFAVSMESFLNVAMNPITVTLYNYFCNHKEHKQIIRVRNYVMIFASIIISAAFPAKFILEVFLPNYIGSSMVMFILFGTQLLSLLNKGFYTNIYKAQRRQKEYFIKLLFVIISGVIFNGICYMIYPVKESFAVGTLLSAALWFVINQAGFKEYGYKFNEQAYIVINLFIFILCGFVLNAVFGLIVYILYFFISTFVFMKKDFCVGIDYVLKMFRRQ